MTTRTIQKYLNIAIAWKPKPSFILLTSVCVFVCVSSVSLCLAKKKLENRMQTHAMIIIHGNSFTDMRYQPMFFFHRIRNIVIVSVLNI